MEGIRSADLQEDLDARLSTLSLIGLCNSAMPWLRKSSSFTIEDVVKAFSKILVSGMSR
ncbi:MAG: hypothetical protein GY789_04290 [Hyphomicrobiales bacterium]|nr:hypothetical protein [Hyphomicrobiales bacterium]